jgi:hypothetical protein
MTKAFATALLILIVTSPAWAYAPSSGRCGTGHWVRGHYADRWHYVPGHCTHHHHPPEQRASLFTANEPGK